MQRVAPRSRPDSQTLHRTRGGCQAPLPSRFHRQGAPRRGAGHGIVLVRPHCDITRCAQCRCRAPSGSATKSGSSGDEEGRRLRHQLWSPPFTSPPIDPADGAMLGRQGRPRRPEQRITGVRARIRNRIRIRGRTRSRGRSRIRIRIRGRIRGRVRGRGRGHRVCSGKAATRKPSLYSLRSQAEHFSRRSE